MNSKWEDILLKEILRTILILSAEKDGKPFDARILNTPLHAQADPLGFECDILQDWTSAGVA